MGLTYKKEEQLRNQPIIETKISKSKDGKYLIHITITTAIKPIAYYEKIFESEGIEEVTEED